MASKKQAYNNPLELYGSYTVLQKPIINFFRSNNVSILTGDAGTGKSWIALYYALMKLKEGSINEIIISKPLIEVGTRMGFLPGPQDEKQEPYLSSYEGAIKKIIGDVQYKRLIFDKKLRFQPVNFVRGENFEKCLVIMDEAQGLTLHELITWVTRLNQDSQMLILGDIFQADIRNSGLAPFLQIAKGIEGIDHMELGDEHQMRNPMIVHLYKNYKQYLQQ